MPDVRSKILRTARGVFQKEGPEGISMRKIADGVGVTATAIYRHFTNKDELIQAVAEEGFGLLEEALLNLPEGKSPRDKLDSIMEAYVSFALKYPRYFDFMFLIPRSKMRSFPMDFDQRQSKAFNVLVDTVEALGKTEDRRDILETALSIWAHGHGLVSLHRTGRFGSQSEPFLGIYRRSTKRLLDGLMSG